MQNNATTYSEALFLFLCMPAFVALEATLILEFLYDISVVSHKTMAVSAGVIEQGAICQRVRPLFGRRSQRASASRLARK